MPKHLELGPNDIEGLYIYGSGELDQLSPLQETTKDGEEILESPLPNKIPLHFTSPLETIKTIQCGQLFTLILSSTGNVYTFGCGDNASLGHPDTPKMSRVKLNFSATGVGGGGCHGIAYNRDNLAFWGQFRNSSGPIGEPCVEPKYFGRNDINNEFYFKAVCGSNHIIILTEEKNIFAFGNNEFGQLGLNPERIMHHFQMNKLYEKNVEDISTGDDHSFLLKYENGFKIIKSWGSNVYGQLGIGSYNQNNEGIIKIYTPTKVIFPGNPNISIKKVTGGAGTSICITEDNRIYVWGYNDFSILGLQDEKNNVIPYPKEIEFFNPFLNNDNLVDDIFASNQYFYAKNKITNKIYSWGCGDSYILGNKKEKAEKTPYLINNLFFKNLYVENISLGCFHVVVLLSEKKNMENLNNEKNNKIKEIKEEKNEVKSTKRKIDEFEEKNEDDNFGMKIRIKEEYIMLNEIDKPKISKIYIKERKFEKKENLNKESIDINIHQKAGNETEKIKNIENEGGKSSQKNKQQQNQSPSKNKKKSKEKVNKLKDDIEMKDETIKIKENNNDYIEKNEKNNTKKSNKKISLKKEKEKNTSEKKEIKNRAKNSSKSQKRQNSSKKKEKSKDKKDNEEEKIRERNQEENNEKKINLRRIDLSNNKEKSSSNKKSKEKEKQEAEKSIIKEKEIRKSKSKSKKKNSSTSKEKEKSEGKDSNNKKQEKKRKSKIKYPKDDIDEIDIEEKEKEKNKKRKNNSLSKKSKRKEKEKEKDENNDNESYKKKEKEDEVQNKRSLRSRKDKIKNERYPKKKK